MRIVVATPVNEGKQVDMEFADGSAYRFLVEHSTAHTYKHIHRIIPAPSHFIPPWVWCFWASSQTAEQNSFRVRHFDSQYVGCFNFSESKA